MAIPYLHFKYITRQPKAEDLPMGRAARKAAKGRTPSAKTVCAAAAYRSGQAIEDEHFGKTYDYSRKQNVEHAEIMAPENAPEWASDRQRLWNAVEEANTRVDSRLAREVTVALPRELDREQQIALTREYVQKAFVDRGMVADVSIHTADRTAKHDNPHAHIMLTTREIGADGFGKVSREWNDRQVVLDARKAWEQTANQHLERAGHRQRISMDRLEDQATAARERGDLDAAIKLTRRPQAHKGPAVTHAERNGTAERYRSGPAQRRYEARRARYPSEIYYREKRGELIREKYVRPHGTPDPQQEAPPQPDPPKRKPRTVDPWTGRDHAAYLEARQAEQPHQPAPQKKASEPERPTEPAPETPDARQAEQPPQPAPQQKASEPETPEARRARLQREADAQLEEQRRAHAERQRQQPAPAQSEQKPDLAVTARLSESQRQQHVELARQHPKAAAVLHQQYQSFLDRKAAELRPEAEKRVALAHTYLDDRRQKAERWKTAAEDKLSELPPPAPKLDRRSFQHFTNSLKEAAAHYGDRAGEWLENTADRISQVGMGSATRPNPPSDERRELDRMYEQASTAETRRELQHLIKQSDQAIAGVEKDREATGITVESAGRELAREHYPHHAETADRVAEYHAGHEERKRLEREKELKRQQAEQRKREREREKQQQSRGGGRSRRIDPPGTSRGR